VRAPRLPLAAGTSSKRAFTVHFDGIFPGRVHTALTRQGPETKAALAYRGDQMSYAMLFLQVRRASLRIAEDVEAHRIPLRADLKLLGLRAQMFSRRMG
jgi:hypothetical protein